MYVQSDFPFSLLPLGLPSSYWVLLTRNFHSSSSSSAGQKHRQGSLCNPSNEDKLFENGTMFTLPEEDDRSLHSDDESGELVGEDEEQTKQNPNQDRKQVEMLTLKETRNMFLWKIAVFSLIMIGAAIVSAGTYFFVKKVRLNCRVLDLSTDAPFWLGTALR